MSDAHPLGCMCHLELPAPDLARAQAFYGEVFGWTFTPMSDTYVLYRDGLTGGGLDKDRPVTSEAGPVPVLMVESIETTLRKIEDWGGRGLTEKIELGEGMGCYAYFRDPNGNKLGIWAES